MRGDIYNRTSLTGTPAPSALAPETWRYWYWSW